jgi:hypothetical protein
MKILKNTGSKLKKKVHLNSGNEENGYLLLLLLFLALVLLFISML